MAKIRALKGSLIFGMVVLAIGLVWKFPPGTAKTEIQRGVMAKPYYELGFSKEDAAQIIVRNAVRSARTSILVSTDATDIQAIAHELGDARNRGVRVRVVVAVRDLEATAVPVQDLARHGVEIRKATQAPAFRQFLVIDGEGNESGNVVMGDMGGVLLVADLDLVTSFRKEWESLWNRGEPL
ncbi:hypothetical protein DIE14_01305 [Burkholderia sp. Bp9017]|uniref:hypothetical protein n=1 Tax=Burkholderia TaxID=32008 RepID=UPI000F5F0CC4|nr:MULTISPECIES: hypothetical protein [unclassified Burkholderia]RQZ31581.1 hypothetical protein DIE14_01305 [Burkholderia sp. Bp9017]RQZ37713.1 hypothetical protein DIE13_01295 [Burkholderia sp. Bp9016]